MGRLLTGATCRFRVWAPNACRVQVVPTDPATGPAFDLAPEGTSGNWSADGIPAVANTKYQYIITNRGGPNNDNSQPWLRTDARALQVESSSPQSMGYVVGQFPSNRQPFTTPSFENFLIYQLHVGSFSGRNDDVTSPTPPPTFASL